MEEMHLNPMSPQSFIEQYFTDNDGLEHTYFDFFKPTIEQLDRFSIGPYYWFIPENHTGKILHISENCKDLSPYSDREWMNLENPNEQAPNVMHPEDMQFIYAATGFGIEMAKEYLLKKIRINVSIYGRFQDADSKYRWMLMQIPDFHFDENRDCHSVLVSVTDISHLPAPQEPMMTILVNGGKREQIFRAYPMQKKLEALPGPKITKREKELLGLMIKGLTSPQIAEALGIAYNTVENHKRNLREKTGSKTAAQLINYVLENKIF
ncbi:MAG: LuxR C-terminal-related transcriptional regulator [Bacteroidetes bacterium]|nr:LuxR C-terminal-related transcriptional regulator [Bacteroidota bacterium]